MNNIALSQTTFHKYLRVILGFRLTFGDHLNIILSKINKEMTSFLIAKHLTETEIDESISKFFNTTPAMIYKIFETNSSFYVK